MDYSVSLGSKYVGLNHVQLQFFRHLSSNSCVHSSFFIYFKYGYFNIKLRILILNAPNVHVGPWMISISPRVINSARWVILIVFVTCWFLKSAFPKKKTILGSLSEWQTVSIQIRTDLLSTLTWVPTVCKGYQQTTEVAAGKKSLSNLV